MTDKLEWPADGSWTMPQLLAAEAVGERLKFVLFWGHTAPATGEVGPHVFSQWWPHEFSIDDVSYATAEHYMMAEKARLFGDEEHLDLILAAETPGEAKKLGRKVRNFDGERWNAERLDVVARGSAAKFASDDSLRTYLVGTGHRVLVEASPRDRIWGIGMGRNNASAEKPSQWRGKNLLGFALMQARAELVSGR